ncbi:MAG TPA: glycosyltransferase family 2 protein [Anaerolineae bacterium]|nr:glycosyltransferase family 2 protein [Anaerolineae bacterium]
MPVYNEQETIHQILERVAAVPVEKEIIVVDDGSSDGTAESLAASQLKDLRFLRHPHNRGKGAAVRTALAAVSGDVVVIQDADLEYDPRDYLKLLAPIQRGEAQVVYGVRDLSGQRHLVRWGNRFLTWLTNLLYGTRLADMETCYKMMTTAVARSLPLRANRFEIEPEITAKLIKRGHRIHQVPIRYTPRIQKKLSPWRDGLPALWTLIKYRFLD